MLFWLFILAVIIQCGYALYFFIRIFKLPGAIRLPAGKRKPVTIIICAKNESSNLDKNLPSILSQKYNDSAGKPMYEVIVVNDASTDDSAAVLLALEQRYDNLWDVVILPGSEWDKQGKKYALSKGVAAAKYEWILLTDADCIPASDRWLEQLVAPLANGKEIVAGYGGYNKGPGLLNAFTRWETMHTFLQYSTYSLAGNPYMAVGRNLACTKSILQKAQQHEVWNALPSGDDDLLVSIAGTANNIAVVSSGRAFTYSDAKATWAEWIKQKQRHLSTGKYYKGPVKFLLGLYGTAHAVMWICFFVLLFLSCWKTAIIIMSVRCLVYWALWGVAVTKLREKSLIYLFPLFDMGWLVYNFAFFPYIALKNKKHWK